MANSRFLKNLELAMRGTRTISVDSLNRGQLSEKYVRG